MENQKEIAVLGGGCFWCTEAIFLALEGVERVESGYCGGAMPNPSYEQVCSGQTGHAEVVLIEFDPGRISFADLLQVFFATHDPTSLNRQGNDQGTQYRSVIFCQSEAQLDEARAVVAELDEARVFASPIVTEVTRAAPYYPAENYHQDYFARNPQQAYCAVMIPPKLKKLKQYFADRLR